MSERSRWWPHKSHVNELWERPISHHARCTLPLLFMAIIGPVFPQAMTLHWWIWWWLCSERKRGRREEGERKFACERGRVNMIQNGFEGKLDYRVRETCKTGTIGKVQPPTATTLHESNTWPLQSKCELASKCGANCFFFKPNLHNIIKRKCKSTCFYIHCAACMEINKEDEVQNKKDGRRNHDVIWHSRSLNV